MAKANKKEALIKKQMTELPSLVGMKELSLQAIQDFPFIEIVDNATATEARKNRTGLVKVRVDLQKQRTLINKKLSEIKGAVKDETDEVIAMTKPHEERQQIGIDLWDEEKQKAKDKKIKLEEIRVNLIKGRISNTEDSINELIEKTTIDNAEEIEIEVSNVLANGRKTGDIDFDFMEFEVLYDDMEERMLKSYNDTVGNLMEIEKKRLEDLDKDQKAQIDLIYRECSELLFSENDVASLKMQINEILSTEYDFGGNVEKFTSTVKTIENQFKARISTLKNEQAQKDKEERLNLLEELAKHREAILKGIENITIDNSDNFKESINTLILKPHFSTDLILPEYVKMKTLCKKALVRKEKVIEKEQQVIDKKKEKDAIALDKRTKERRAELRVFDLETIGDSFTGFGMYIGNDKITLKTNKEWEKLIAEIPEAKKVFKANDKKEKLRQKNLKSQKETIIKELDKVRFLLDIFKINDIEIQGLVSEIHNDLQEWKNKMEIKVNEF